MGCILSSILRTSGGKGVDPMGILLHLYDLKNFDKINVRIMLSTLMNHSTCIEKHELF